MAARKGNVVITPEVFKIAKKMLDAGVSQKEVAACLGVSVSTICRVSHVDDYGEWKEFQKKRSAQIQAKKSADADKPEPQVVETKQTIVVQASQLMAEEMKKTNELLTLINNKLGAIINDLYGIKND